MTKHGILALFLLLSATGFAQQPPDTAQQIAYVRTGAVQDAGLWVSTIDGKHRMKIADFGMMPKWAPDGTRIAYGGSPSYQGFGSGPLNLYIYDLATRKSVPLTSLKAGDQAVRASSWSPDGKRIVYAVMTKKGTQILLVDVATKETTPIELSGGIDCASEPDWAPDGRLLAVHDCSKDQRGLAVIDLGGKLIRRLTQPDSGVYDGSPAWSPDGKRIAFVSTRGDPVKRGPAEARRTSIFVINADGTDLHQLVFDKELSLMFPNWSSDGTLFVCDISRIGPAHVGPALLMSSKVIVMNVSDWKVRTTLGDNTSQPALAPTGK